MYIVISNTFYLRNNINCSILCSISIHYWINKYGMCYSILLARQGYQRYWVIANRFDALVKGR